MKISAFCSVLIVLIFCGCSGWTYNGVPGDQFTWKHAVGICAGFGSHAAGHLLAAKLMNKDCYIDGQSEIINDTISDSEAAWMGRAGFLGSLGPAYLAKAMGWDGAFWQGYDAGVVVLTLAYPLTRNSVRGGGDDLKLIARHSNPWIEWGIYSVLAIYLSYNDKIIDSVEWNHTE